MNGYKQLKKKKGRKKKRIFNKLSRKWKKQGISSTHEFTGWRNWENIALLTKKKTSKLHLLLTLGFPNETLVNMRKHTASSDGSLDQWVQLFVTTDSKLKMPRCNTFDFEVLGRITSQFKNFCCQIFQNSCRVYRSLGSYTCIVSAPFLQITMNTTNGELHRRKTFNDVVCLLIFALDLNLYIPEVQL